MSSQYFVLRQNDTSPAIAGQLLDAATGDPVNLVGASVNFQMRPRGGGDVKVNAAGTVSDPAAGKVRYDWSAADTDTAGVFDASWEVTYADGAVETFPNHDNLLIRILDDLA